METKNKFSIINAGNSEKIGHFLSTCFERIRELVGRVPYYLKIWLLMSKNSFMVMLEQKKFFSLFLLAKIIRFSFFMLFLVYLMKGTESLAGYTSSQVIFFFLTFNLIDVFSQFLFREVYRFRPLLVSGDFDLMMSKPMNALFRVLMGGADVIDFVTIPPLLLAVLYVGNSFQPNIVQILLYLFLIINSFIIAASLHILVLAFGILTLEIDHLIWIYRDLTNLGRFPIDIYSQPIKGLLTYLVPVGIMMTFPVKAMLGLISFWGIIVSFILGIFLLFLAIRFWNFALKGYTSASS